jgi:TRAP-type C4-dicarboxylate transport system permease small subunit
MWLNQIADSLNKVVHPLSKVINGVAAAALAILMFMTALDVSLRYFLDMPITGSYDLAEYLMVIIISFGLAYCAVEKEHVKVELIISLFGQRTQNLINAITSLLSLILFSVLAVQSVNYIVIMHESKAVYSVLLIPIYPSVAIVACGFFVLCLVLLADFLESLAKVIGR